MPEPFRRKFEVIERMQHVLRAYTYIGMYIQTHTHVFLSPR